MNHYIIES